MNSENQARLQQSYVIDKSGGAVDPKVIEEIIAQEQKNNRESFPIQRSFVVEGGAGRQTLTTHSQEINRNQLGQGSIEVRKSYIVTPIQEQGNMVQNFQTMQTMPMQMVQVPMQMQTVQMPVQYVQMAMPMQSSQLVQVAQEPQVVIQRDDEQIKVLMEENKKLRITLEDWRVKLLEFERRGPQIVEKVVEKVVERPIEIVKVDERRIRELEGELAMLRDEKSRHEGVKRSAMQDKNFLENRIRELEEELKRRSIQIEEWRSKFTMLEMQGPKIIEKKIEVPVEVVKIDDRRIRELEEELRKSRTIIEEWRSKVTFLEMQGPKIVEKRVEVPVEVIKEKVIVDDKRIRELEFQFNGVIEENKRLKVTLEEWRMKLLEFEEHKGHAERAKRSANQDKAYFEGEIVRLKKQIEELLSRGPQIIEKIVEKPVEIIKVDDRRIRELEGELNFLREENRKIKISIEEWRSKYSMLEMQGPKIVEKRIEVPVEVVKFDDRRIRELEGELNFLREENRKIKISIEEWRSKYSMLEMQGPKIVEKRIEVPVEVIKEKVIVDDRRIRELDGELNFLREENRKIKISIEEWRSKYSMLEMQGPKIVEKRIEVPVEVIKEKVVVDDRRIRELDGELNFLREENRKIKISIEEWRSKYSRLEMQGPKIIEKKIEVPVEVVKYVDKIIEKPFEVVKEKIVVDDRRIRELEIQINGLIEENKRLKVTLDEWRVKLIEFEEHKGHAERAKRSANQDKAYFEGEIVRLKKQIEELLSRGPQIIEKVVEKPVEIIKIDDRRIRELEGELNFLREENRKIRISIEEWRSKYSMLEMQGPKIIEKKIEIPVEVVKYVDKIIEKPYEVVKEKIVVDDRRIREVEGELNFLREENRKIRISIEEWRSKYTSLEMQGPKIVEKRIEVPVEVVKYVDKIIEKPFEVVKEKIVVDDRRIRELEIQINGLIEENRRLKVTLDEWRIKLIEFEEHKGHAERAKKSANQDKAYFEGEIVRLKKQIEELLSRGPQIIEKVVEKPVEIIKIDDRRIRELEGELNFLREENRKIRISIEEWRSKYSMLEMQGPKIVEKRVEIPVEVVKYVDKIIEKPFEVVKEKIVVDDRRIRELENELNFFREENRKIKISIEEWRSKYSMLEMQGPKIVEKRIEVPVEVIKEKVIVDDRRIRELENEINFLREENRKIKISIEEWRSKYSVLEMQGPKIVEKRIEIPVEVIKEKVIVDESKVVQLTYEIERLRQVIDLRGKEIDDWKSRYSKLEIQITDLRGRDGKVIELENRIAMMASEIERLNGFIRKLKEENEGLTIRITEFRGYEGRIAEYENRIAMMASEMERLNGLIKRLREENDGLNIRITEFRGHEGRISEYENRIAMMASEIERLNGLIKRLREDNDGLNIRISEFRGYEGRVTEYENRIAMMASEIERLNGFIRKLREENDSYLIRIREFDEQKDHHERAKKSSAQDKSFLEGKVAMLTSEIERLTIIINELRGKEGHLIEYENRLAMLSSETSRLQTMLKMRGDELESWKSKYLQIESSMVQFRDADMKLSILNQEIERLNGVVLQQKTELDEWRFKYVEYSSLTQTIQEHLVLFVRLFAEIESLRGRVVQKDQEMEEMRKSGLMQVLNKY